MRVIDHISKCIQSFQTTFHFYLLEVFKMLFSKQPKAGLGQTMWTWGKLHTSEFSKRLMEEGDI